MIFQISERRMQGSAFPVRDILKDTIEHIEKLYDRKEHITGLATGFDDLDSMTSGFQPSRLHHHRGPALHGQDRLRAQHRQATRPSRTTRRALVFSLEMSKEQLVQRLLCAEARVDSHKVRIGYLDPREWTPHHQRGGPARRGAHLHRRHAPPSPCWRRAPRRGA